MLFRHINEYTSHEFLLEFEIDVAPSVEKSLCFQTSQTKCEKTDYEVASLLTLKELVQGMVSVTHYQHRS